MTNLHISNEESGKDFRLLPELRTSVLCFGLSGFLHGIPYVLLGEMESINPASAVWFILMHLLAFSPIFVIICFLIFSLKNVALQASLLGNAFAVGILITQSFSLSLWHPFGVYICVMAFFHWSEYVCTALTSPSTLSLDSFLLNHSLQYWIAAGASWFEFGLGICFLPKLKTFPVISAIGFLMCIVGEVIRKCAMLTASHNFTHLISFQKKETHQLITHGIYSIFRHPGYLGWFLWGVGTQVLLCNPICSVAYIWAIWNFFSVRIEDEEVTLINFFGEDYVHYQRRVPTGIPFVIGFRPDLTAP